MFTYRVEFYNDNSFHVIEAEYFNLSEDKNGAKEAYFYVRNKSDTTEHPMGKEVLVGYVRNPVLIKFDDTYVVRPKETVPGFVSGNTKPRMTMREHLARERDERATFTFPGENHLDRDYTGL